MSWPDEEICHHLDANLILTEKQRGCWKRSRGTRDIAMGWINYRKAFDIIPPSWILKFEHSGNYWRDTIFASEKYEIMNSWIDLWTNIIWRGENKERDISGNSPLLSIISIIPMSAIVKNTKPGDELASNMKKINHLFYMLAWIETVL